MMRDVGGKRRGQQGLSGSNAGGTGVRPVSVSSNGRHCWHSSSGDWCAEAALPWSEFRAVSGADRRSVM